jgi:dTDP-4-amino-4,6-dideoxygalactose transaminase
LGWNSRLDALQALYLSSQLPRLDEMNFRRRQIASEYLKGIHFNDHVQPLTRNLGESNVWHHFVLIVNSDRDRYRTKLNNLGIGTEIHYPEPAYSASCFGNARSQKFPMSNFISDSCLSIPVYPWLSDLQIEQVIGSINRLNKED